jgi:hypothetical protein
MDTYKAPKHGRGYNILIVLSGEPVGEIVSSHYKLVRTSHEHRAEQSRGKGELQGLRQKNHMHFTAIDMAQRKTTETRLPSWQYQQAAQQLAVFVVQ